MGLSLSLVRKGTLVLDGKAILGRIFGHDCDDFASFMSWHTRVQRCVRHCALIVSVQKQPKR